MSKMLFAASSNRWLRIAGFLLYFRSGVQTRVLTQHCVEETCEVQSRFRSGDEMPKTRATKRGPKEPKDRVRVLITARRIRERILALAKQIRKVFPGEKLHLVSVLKGGVFFLTDLARHIPGNVSFDFLAVASYGQNTHSSGQVRLTRDLDSSIE